MVPRFLCCVALWLLGTGPVDSGVSQTPKHLIKARKQEVILKCSYISGHRSVYWYKQAQGEGLQFLVQFYNSKETQKGDMPHRFSVQQQLSDSCSELNVSSLELEDSAMYLCASSLDTALQARQPPAQKLSAQDQEVM